MQKNVSGQKIGAQLVSATDGSAFTGSVTVAVTGDAGTQATGSVGSGACTHEGNGYHTYAPAQAETNYDLIAFTFTGTGAVPVTVQVFTTAPNFNTLTIANNCVDADVERFNGTAGTFSGGRPEVNTTHAAGTAWGSGAITAGSIASDAITAAKIADGAIDRATFAADTGLQTVRSNTAQAGASTSITLDASASSTTDFYKYCVVYITGGTGVGQYRVITAYNGTTKVATVTPAWATNPDNTSTFAVKPEGIADLETILGVAVSTSTAQLGVNVVNAGGTAWGSGAITAASIAADAITAAKIANGAIDAATFAADVDAEILSYIVDDATRIDASGLNTSTATTIPQINTTVTDIYTSVGSAGDGLTAIPWGSAADAIWDEAISGHLTGGTTGAALNAAGSAGDPWSTPLPGAYTSGTAGKIIGDNINATISSRSSHSATDVWAAGTRTLTAGTNIQLPSNGLANVTTWAVAITGNVTGNLSGSVGSVTGAVGSVTGTVGGIAGTITTLDALDTAQDTQHGTTQTSIAALNNLSSAQAQTAATAALNAYDPPTRSELTTDTNSILAQLPAAPVKNSAFTYVIKMVDATDGMTPETGLTITVTRSIDGAAFASATGAITEISTGHYKFVASAADMNGDFVVHRFVAAGAQDLTMGFLTVS